MTAYFKSEFWTRLVLQLGTSEPAIRHALTSIGSAHSSRRQFAEQAALGTPRSEGEANNTSFALNEYNRAIHALNQKLSAEGPKSIKVVLICCVLFVCIEALRRSPERGMKHIEAGIKIHNDWLHRTKRTVEDHEPQFPEPQFPSALELEGSLWRLFLRLDNQMFTMIGKRDPSSLFKGWKDAMDPRNLTVGEFFEIGHAQDALDRMSKMVFEFINSNRDHKFSPLEQIPSEVLIEQRSLINGLDEFAVSLAKFLDLTANETFDESDKRSINILKMHVKTLFIMTEESVNATETSIDRFNPEFEAIMDYGESIINSIPLLDPEAKCAETSETNPPDPSGPWYPTRVHTFTLATGMVSSLYYTAQTCRSMPMRRRAIALLRGANVGEGLWCSVVASRVASKTIEAQLSGLETDTRKYLGVIELGRALGVIEKGESPGVGQR